MVDDRLPVYRDRLLFVHSATNNEFWSALLEKAYAKVHGRYSKLDGGNAADALVDFTAGISRQVDLNGPEAAPGCDNRQNFSYLYRLVTHYIAYYVFRAPRKLLYKEIRRAGQRSMMSASISVPSAGEIESVLSTGLVVGHAYGVRSFAAFNRVPMVQMYNP